MRIQRHPGSPRILEVRPLTEADLETLRQPTAHTRLHKIRDSHHMVARLMASGLKVWEVAQRTGFSAVRLSVLLKDPAIQDLIAYYRNLVTEDWRENVDSIIEDNLAALRLSSRMIRDRLEDADEGEVEVTTKELVAIKADAADRFGYGKKTHNTNINIDFAANLEAAIARSKKVSAA